MDSHSRNFVPPNYGDAFPNGGYVDPTTGQTLYSDYAVIDIRETDRQMWDVCYRKLPGALISGSVTDPQTGIKTDYTKQIVKSGTVSGGIIGSVIETLALVSGGTGYTGNGTLVFSGGGGTGATGTFTYTAPSTAGAIAAVAVTNGGIGYTTTPAVAVGGGGSGAVVLAVLAGSFVNTLTLISSDTTFTDAATLTITDVGGGYGATGTAALTPTTIGSVPVDNGGTGYTVASVAFSGGGGTGAAANVTITGGAISAISLTNAGSGYTSRPSVTITGDGTGATAHSVLTNTTVASVTLTAGGTGYMNPLVTCTDGTATASVNAVIAPTKVASLTISSHGSGYSSPTLSFSGGGGSGATGTATISTGTVTGVSLTNPGSGYTSNPTVTTSGGGGSGAVITATIGGVTYVDVEPQTAGQDLVMRTSVDLVNRPPEKFYPVTFRVRFKDTQTAYIQYYFGPNNIDLALNETDTIGGSGIVIATLKESYLTDAEYQVYSTSGVSTVGQSVTSTLVYGAEDSNGYVRAWTFRTTPVTNGTSAGTVDLSSEKLKYGMWKVMEIVLNQSY